MTIQIDQGSYTDLDAMEQLYHEVHEALNAGVNYPGWKEGVYPTREDAATGVEEQSLFVARDGNRIVGAVILNHESEPVYSTGKWQYQGDDSTVFVVHTLVVHPDFAKMGIGAELMNFAERFGRQNKMKAIRLDVYEKNTPAIRLYERCGFRYVQTVDLGLGCYGLDWFRLYEKLL